MALWAAVAAHPLTKLTLSDRFVSACRLVLLWGAILAIKTRNMIGVVAILLFNVYLVIAGCTRLSPVTSDAVELKLTI